MKIYCSRGKLRDLRQQRDAIVEDYNRRKAVYDEQVGNFDTAYASHEDKVLSNIKSQLSAELKALPGVEIHVSENSDTSNGGRVVDKEYGVKITYQSPTYNDKTKNMLGVRNLTERTQVADSGWYSSSKSWGFNWILFIRWVEKDNRTFILKNPVIKADMIEDADYDTLAATYDLFSKISTINWVSVLEDANTGVPKKSDYVTEPYPGNSPNTSEIDKQISKSQIEDYVGEDVWVKANYYSTGNTRYPDKDVYIKLVSEGPTKAYYYGYMVSRSDWYWNSDIHWEGDKCILDEDAYRRFTSPSKVKKLRKAGIQLTQPLEIFSTDELFEIKE